MKIAIACHGDGTTTRGVVVALTATIHDDGRQIALYGDQATCGNCKGLWNIVGTGEGVGEGIRAAVINGDHVLCPCGRNRVIASPDAGMWMEIGGGAVGSVSYAKQANGVTSSFDQRFTLRDGNGRALPDTFYTVCFPSGELKRGVTDHAGRTARYATDGERHLAVYLGHREA